MNSFVEILVVMLGGGLGAISRFALDRKLKSAAIGLSPMVSLTIINVIGSAVLGILLGVAYVYGGSMAMSNHGEAMLNARPVSNLVSTWLVPLVGTGFCGGFTTFSTAIVEALPSRLRIETDATTPHSPHTPTGPSRWFGVWQLIIMTAACVVAALLGYVAALLVMAP